MIVPGIFVCSSFLISVCMFIVSKTFLIMGATVIVRLGGAIWLTFLLGCYLMCDYIYSVKLSYNSLCFNIVQYLYKVVMGVNNSLTCRGGYLI